MGRAVTASAFMGFAVAVAGYLPPPAAAARPRPLPPALETRESLHQSLSLRAHGPSAGVAIRETRRLRASLLVDLPDLDPAAVTGNTYVGLRIGDWAFERPVSFDRTWRPGRTSASFRVGSSDPSRRGVTLVRARWSETTLRISVVSTSEAPIAATQVAAAAGPVISSIDGAARLGGQHVHLGGTARGNVTRRVLAVLDSSADLARVELAGRAEVVADTADSDPPVVTITRPAAVATVAPGTLTVEGAVRDGRSIASLAWSIDGGTSTSVPFHIDPSSGFLDDLRATFSFSVPATDGPHALRVLARDAAGNTGSATIDFTVPSTTAAVLRTAKWGATCVDDAGRVQSWGYGTRSPTVVPGIAGARYAAGTLAVLGDATVTTLHGGPSGTPSPITGLADIADVAQSSTTSASYALGVDGTVWAWGDNVYAQLGDGTTTSRSAPAQVPGLPPIAAISAGAYHAMALDRQGGVWTWGGLRARSDAAARSPAQVAGVANAVAISASQFDRYATGAAVLADGTLWMWGDATSGQLGGAVSGRELPAFQVPGVSGARSVAMGYNHALLLRSDGTVLARGGPTSEVWGYWGELGNGSSTPDLEFQPVPGLSGVAQVAAGAHTSHALMQDGTLRAWGQNTFGSVGDGTTTDALSPVVVLLAK